MTDKGEGAVKTRLANITKKPKSLVIGAIGVCFAVPILFSAFMHQSALGVANNILKTKKPAEVEIRYAIDTLKDEADIDDPEDREVLRALYKHASHQQYAEIALEGWNTFTRDIDGIDPSAFEAGLKNANPKPETLAGFHVALGEAKFLGIKMPVNERAALAHYVKGVMLGNKQAYAEMFGIYKRYDCPAKAEMMSLMLRRVGEIPTSRIRLNLAKQIEISDSDRKTGKELVRIYDEKIKNGRIDYTDFPAHFECRVDKVLAKYAIEKGLITIPQPLDRLLME